MIRTRSWHALACSARVFVHVLCEFWVRFWHDLGHVFTCFGHAPGALYHVLGVFRTCSSHVLACFLRVPVCLCVCVLHAFWAWSGHVLCVFCTCLGMFPVRCGVFWVRFGRDPATFWGCSEHVLDVLDAFWVFCLVCSCFKYVRGLM